MRLDFRALPLVEVQIRLTAASPMLLGMPALSRLTVSLTDRFTEVRHSDNLETPPGLQNIFNLALGQPLGLDFLDPMAGIQVRLQPMLLAASWRKDRLDRDGDYPHFERLAAALHDVRTELSKALETESMPQYQVAAMSYTNFIATDDTPTYRDVALFLSDDAMLPLVRSDGVVHEFEIAWKNPDTTDLRFQIRASIKAPDGGDPNGFFLTTIAGTRFEPLSDPSGHVDRVHDQLQHLFISLISERAKDTWQLST